MVYMGFRSLLADDRTAEDYLTEIRNGGTNRRWPAAYELSRMMADPKVRADRRFAPALLNSALGSLRQRRRSARPPLSRAGARPPRSAAAGAGGRQPDQDARRPDSEARISAITALSALGRRIGRSQASAVLSIIGCRHQKDGGVCARRAAWRRADSDAADGAAGFGRRRALERRRRARAPRQPRGRVCAGPDAWIARTSSRPSNGTSGRTKTRIRLPTS